MAVQPSRPRLQFATSVLASPRFSAALTTATLGTAVFSFALRQLIGWPGFIAVLSGLLVLAFFSLAGQWREIGWSGLLPISLLTFFGWAAVSIFWSQYHWATLAGVAYLLVFTLLAVYVALVRDTIQIVRVFGDVLRFALALSLVMEVFSGILIDTPLRFLGIQGRIAELGPITGLFNTSDQLGLLSVIALISFGVELRTRSISRWVGIGSIALAGVSLLLSRAPLAFGAALLVAAAAGALYGLRRAPARALRFLQLGLLVLLAAIAIAAWAFRGYIVAVFNANGALSYRLTLWHEVWSLVQSRFLQGWGWVGSWPIHTDPFAEFAGGPRFPGSSLNAYLDVWFQLGIVGFALFILFLGLAVTRSWLLASRRRSIVFAWPALVLVALAIGALAESSLLIEFGWLAAVVCSVKASRELSWRNAFESTLRPEIIAPEEPLTD